MSNSWAEATKAALPMPIKQEKEAQSGGKYMPIADSSGSGSARQEHRAAAVARSGRRSPPSSGRRALPRSPPARPPGGARLPAALTEQTALAAVKESEKGRMPLAGLAEIKAEIKAEIEAEIKVEIEDVEIKVSAWPVRALPVDGLGGTSSRITDIGSLMSAPVAGSRDCPQRK